MRQDELISVAGKANNKEKYIIRQKSKKFTAILVVKKMSR
ncbi:hypothetical protein DOT_4662 [Desulfosporosinus sp. OT]|nr:hypothetical protein DOT_4662 [Desulfosporosinus sp. OT]